MSRLRLGTVGVVLLLCLWPREVRPSSETGAWPSAFPQAMNFTVDGKISRQSPGKLTLSTQENMVFHARYDDKTEIRRPDGSPGSGKDLRVGAMIRLEGDLTEAGEIVAARIELLSQNPPRPR